MPPVELTAASLKSILPIYYKRIFPYDFYYKWLSYGCKEYMSRREISFTLAGDIYCRYQSFDNMDDLMNAILKNNPQKIDIGAIYNCKPKNHKTVDVFGTIEKEIVFDIDLSDYDEVRTCCQGDDICNKCWKFMVIACKTMDVALREDFGYEQLLWVFSGRRGIHCWVCDESARKLHNRGRKAVARYLNLIQGGVYKTKRVSLPGEQMHHSVARAFSIAEPYFKEVCLEDQDILGTEAKLEGFIKVVSTVGDCESLKNKMLQKENSLERWEVFLDHYKSRKDTGVLSKKARNLLEEIVLQYLYPRLDLHVTKGMNHLLKSPFSIHPKTGKVSIPFNPATVDEFSSDTVPTIGLLVQEIYQFEHYEERYETEVELASVSSEVASTPSASKAAAKTISKAAASAARIKDYNKTSLYNSLVFFEKFVQSLELIKCPIDLMDF